MTDVEALLRRAASDRSVISFAGGLPSPETFPREALAKAAHDAVWNMGTDPMQYGWPEGQQALREQIITHLSRLGVRGASEDLHVCNGAQDAIGLVLQALEPKQVQVDALSYPAALDLIRSRGAEPTVSSAPLRYVMPTVANPRGDRLDVQGRRALLDSEWILEDDAYGQLWFGAAPDAPIVSTAPRKTFYVGTLSKTVAPGLRIGWLLAPSKFRDRLRELKASQDLQSNGLTQAIASRLLGDQDAFLERLSSLRTEYARRMRHLAGLLETVPGLRFSAPEGGFSIWVETGREGDDEAFLRRAIEDFKVAFDPGHLFHAVAGPHPLGLRLSYSALPESLFEDGVRRLKALLSAR